MKNKNIIITTLLLIVTIFSACKKEDEMKPPSISFKTGGSYVSSSVSLPAGSALLIGIEASKSESEGEDEDVLTHFNISRSLNAGTDASVYNVDLTAAQEEEYDYDFATPVSTTVGDTEKYTFTITNRDGLTGQVSLTVTAQ